MFAWMIIVNICYFFLGYITVLTTNILEKQFDTHIFMLLRSFIYQIFIFITIYENCQQMTLQALWMILLIIIIKLIIFSASETILEKFPALENIRISFSLYIFSSSHSLLLNQIIIQASGENSHFFTLEDVKDGDKTFLVAFMLLNVIEKSVCLFIVKTELQQRAVAQLDKLKTLGIERRTLALISSLGA